jgi:hypothetical protein
MSSDISMGDDGTRVDGHNGGFNTDPTEGTLHRLGPIRHIGVVILDPSEDRDGLFAAALEQQTAPWAGSLVGKLCYFYNESFERVLK